MAERARPRFAAGNNSAVKMPPGDFERLVAFYRDTIGLKVQETGKDGEIAWVRFAFGSMQLWVDRVPALSQGEVWLELATDDTPGAAAWLGAHGVAGRDEIEALPEGLEGFWVAAPGGMIHLVADKGA